MMMTRKKIASHLAKALAELGKARFLATGRPFAMEIADVESRLRLIFHQTGYEYSSADSVRIRQSKPEKLRLPGTGSVVLGKRHTRRRPRLTETQCRDEKRGLYL